MPSSVALPRTAVFFQAVLLTLLAAVAAVTRAPLLVALAAWAGWGAVLFAHLAAPKAAAAPATTNSARNRWVRAGVALRRLGAALGRGLRVCLLPLGGAAGLALAGFALAEMRANGPATHPGALAPALALAAFASFFLQTFLSLRARHGFLDTPAGRLTGAWLRLQTILFAVAVVVLFAEGYVGFHLHTPLIFAVLGLMAAGIVEVAIRAAARFYYPTRARAQLPPLGYSWLLLPFMASAERALWHTSATDDTPGIALAEMWFLPTLRRLTLPLCGLVAALLWLSTCFHEVPHGNVGLWSRFGRMQPEPLAAGLHFTLPYPLNEVSVLPHERLQRIVLGLESDTGKPLLWDREHYVGESNHLVGGGEDLLTISVPIYFHVADPIAHYRHTVDAAAVIRDLAYQELLAETLERPAFAVMTTDRGELAETLKRKLQAALDRRQTGLVVDMVCLRDVHPPVQVGPFFQDVVSAIEDKEAFMHQGENYRAENLPRAASDAAKLRASADADLSTRVAKAMGEAATFAQLHESYRANPEVFRIREAYAAYDGSLRGVKKLLVDDAFRGRLPTFIDVRKTLNPDFNPPTPPMVPTLIPSIDNKANEFSRTIEGYLRMGNGAIPAVAPMGSDPDSIPKSR